jgi:hypothetical protein
LLQTSRVLLCRHERFAAKPGRNEIRNPEDGSDGEDQSATQEIRHISKVRVEG